MAVMKLGVLIGMGTRNDALIEAIAQMESQIH